jgi:tRNA(Ile2) C34 agmatinyltransferase TiaS
MALKKIAQLLGTEEKCLWCGQRRIESKGTDKFFQNTQGGRVQTQDHLYVESSIPPDYEPCSSQGRRHLKTFEAEKRAAKNWPRG